MMKKLLLLLLCTALIVSGFASCSDKEDSLTETETVESEDNLGGTISTDNIEEADKLDDTVLISLLENMLYKNGLKIVNWMCSGADLSLNYDTVFETDNPAIEYVLVENIQDMQAFKIICEQVFSKEFLSANVYPDLIEGDYPLFTEKDGKLYYNKNTGGGYPFAPDFTRANVTSNEAEAFEIEVPMTEAGDEEGKMFAFKAVRQNGNWVLDNFYSYFQ